MDPWRLWPDFDDAWILYEDESLIAVDKPAGIPSQAADPAHPDDLVTRLRGYLERRARERGGRASETYLGVHQRLDKDTSGVLVMTLRRDANASMAAQFEGRKVDKRYKAAVSGWERKGEVELRDWLAPGDGGRMRVARAGGGAGVRAGAGAGAGVRAGAGAGERGADLAVTRVREIARRGDRSILDLRLETGRTHQARVQLANAGAAVAGDRLYEGAEAPRLMLHASEIHLVHPKTQEDLAVLAPTPPDFDLWLESGDPGARIYDDPSALERTLKRAVMGRYALGHAGEGPEATTAFRLVNDVGDGLPGLVVDLFGEWLVAELHGDDTELFGNEARKERVLDALEALGTEGVYLKVRPKQASTLVDTRREDLAPKLPVRGTPAPFDVTVHENGIPYRVRLGDGLQTGLFLDQRANRLRVRDAAKGKRVCNLFAYTCAFSVAAARGGAITTVSVDAAIPALERGRENFELSGIPAGTSHSFVAEDCFAWLARARKKGELFDLVLLDPPSYSSTKKRRFVAKTDYTELAAEALALLAPGGTLFACLNHRGIPKGRFRKILHDAARSAHKEVLQAKDLPTPSDFPTPQTGESHLKAVWLTIR
jgi:23S rRNA (cytosine1962-C5)-methyltransferase